MSRNTRNENFVFLFLRRTLLRCLEARTRSTFLVTNTSRGSSTRKQHNFSFKGFLYSFCVSTFSLKQMKSVVSPTSRYVSVFKMFIMMSIIIIDTIIINSSSPPDSCCSTSLTILLMLCPNRRRLLPADTQRNIITRHYKYKDK